MRSGSEVRSRRGMTTQIHPTAIVHPDAELGEGVEVGPFAIIDATVKIGDRTKVGPRVTIEGHTTLGSDNEIFTGAVLGSPTQDKKFDGGVSYVRIGNHNKIREYVTVNPGTKEGTETVIGNNNLLMAYVHIAHDCMIGNNCILANNATLAGHVHLGDWVFLGGFTTIHQFCHIGAHAMTAFTAAVSQDVPPYVTAAGNRAVPHGINSEGLKRRGFTPESITQIKRAYKVIYRNGLSLDEAKLELAEMAAAHPEVAVFLNFITESTRGIIR